ncbi:MAG: hypothetical protein KAR79_02260 [Simkaniaceae bacterium]|nr:hypothetical protein [Simkaniaceae bacterium]
MIKKALFALLLFFPFGIYSLDVKPWFHDLWQIYFTPSYAYSYYPSVAGGVKPSHYSSHNQLISYDLGVSFLEKWDTQIEVEFARSSKLDWGARSGAMQVRYLVLDDVAGDFISLTVGGNLRWVPSRNLRDVSCPYHSHFNAELGVGLGKEIDRVFNWLYRVYGYMGVGIANHGAPWIKPLAAFEFNYRNRHRYKVFSEGYFGFGSLDRVNIRSFYGYGKVQHQSVDIGGTYEYLFKIWGSFSFDYSFRVYAHNYPQFESRFKFAYNFPFSIF